MNKKILSILIAIVTLVCAFGLSSCKKEDNTVYFVTFNYNYEKAPASVDVNVKSGNVVTPPSDIPTRDGYVFDAWYKNSACTESFDVKTEKITEDITLYAGWKDDDSYVKITFDLSNVNKENVVYKVKKGELTSQPEIIVPGYECRNWYKDADKKSKFLWGLQINNDVVLYGDWAKQYTFEAEYCKEIGGMTGVGFSGNTSGLNMIERDLLDKGASNGFYVTYLYRNGLGLQFNIDSESEASGARMLLRLSTQYMDLALDSNLFEVKVTYEDGTSIAFSYPLIEISPDSMGTSGEKAAFKDFLITEKLTLKKGENVISLKVVNSGITLGTMEAYAPIIDCLKITTDANLTWTKNCEPSNINGK